MNNSVNSTIKNVYIKGFKVFEEESFEFRNLTLLTGENSSGKSSLIQAILYAGNPGFIRTPFNGDLIEYLQFLGGKELFNKFTNSQKIDIDIKFNNEQKVGFTKDKVTMQIKGIAYPNPISYPENLIYLSADRHRISQINQFRENLKDRHFGIYGDLASSYYAHHKRNPIENYLIKDEDSFTLETQVNYWLKYITNIKTLSIEVEKVTPTLVRNIFKYNDIEFLPENLGTGLSYLFAILVICLTAKRGNIIIIENPEIHLHPKSQAKLGEFFAFIASKGIQLVIETHNDHIVNKICYEIYKNNLSKDDVIIHYFEIPYKKTTIFIDDGGNFVNDKNESIGFPEGFFDATLKEIFEINGY